MNKLVKSGLYAALAQVIAVGILCSFLMFFGGQGLILSGAWVLCWAGCYLYLCETGKGVANANEPRH